MYFWFISIVESHNELVLDEPRKDAMVRLLPLGERCLNPIDRGSGLRVGKGFRDSDDLESESHPALIPC
ncbi:hypothetical protein AAHA92_10338 [Salvia divinorum]|uniref:Uncharacterized protein n=1 Tax=Salvia divinorum TaxID=28513 RepID=A0ABD1HUF3_SALDI